MKCPNCNATLVMSERSGVEIDYCPECRGVWLDRGELDKIIERSSQPYSANQKTAGRAERQPKEEYDDFGHHKKRKRESFLGELFDF